MKRNFYVCFLSLLLLLLPVSRLKAQQASDLNFYASLNYQAGWVALDNPPMGIYSFQSKDPLQLSPLHLNPKLLANGGAVYIDGKYYLIGYDIYSDGAVDQVYYRVFDMEKEALMLTEIHLGSTVSTIPTDLTYDPVTDRVYGCFYQSPTDFALGILNLTTGRYQVVGKLSEQLVTLSANREGDLYGIGIYGTFYRVNKETAELTAVGPTNLVVRYAQSASFDYGSGKLYWVSSMHNTSDPNGFYEIDLTTGKPSLIAEIPQQSELTGLYTKTPYTLSGAPAKPELVLDYPEGSLNGSVSLVLPDKSFGGSALTGNLEYTLWIDDVQVAKSSAAPGSKKSFTHNFTTAGYHWVRVRVSNATGMSPHCESGGWFGLDEICVSDVTATVGDSGVDISWKAPEKGVHGGYVPVDQLSYLVKRRADDLVVYQGKELKCRDTNIPDQYAKHSYSVITLLQGVESGSVVSNEVGFGRPLEIPFTQDFSSMAGYDLFTVIDANQDGYAWHYDFQNGCVSYEYSELNAADDWIVTPPLHLDADYVYEVKFGVRSGDCNYPERMKVAAGTEAKAEALDKVLMKPFVIDWDNRYKTQKAVLVPDKTGTVYVGFQACSDVGSFTLNMNEISVDRLASVYAPDSVADLKVKAGEKGALVADVQCTLPRTTIKGNSLTAITRVELYLNGSCVQTLNGVAPGQQVQFTQVKLSGNGTYAFSVLVYNDLGAGLEAKTSVFVGEDIPGGITGIKSSSDSEGNVSITWDVPTVGRHGGYINPEGLQYRITEKDEVTTHMVETNAFQTKVDVPEGCQELIWYDIQPISKNGSGWYTNTDTLFVGKPFPVPFKESFRSGRYEMLPWNVVSDGVGTWKPLNYTSYEGGDPQDKDGGMVVFLPYLPDKRASLFGPKVSLKGVTYPALRFWVWHNKKVQNEVQVILHTSTGESHVLEVINQDQMEGTGEYGWIRHQYPLDAYKECEYVQLEFAGRSKVFLEHEINQLLLDNISIFCYYQQDLALTGVHNAGEIEVGKTLDFEVEVENLGSRKIGAYQVNLYRDNKLVDKQELEGLGVDEKTTVVLHDIPNADAAETSYYQVEACLDGDENEENNLLEPVAVTVLPGLPYVDTLKGSVLDGKAVLTWESPVAQEEGGGNEMVTDDFESYPAFSITNAGKWKFYDGDRAATFGIQDGSGNFVDYPNQGSEMAFMVFNPSEAGLGKIWKPYSGSQVMACFTSGYTQNDDWLISPEVDGAQTITFQAQSTDSQYFGTTESIEVLYSITDDKPESFTRLGNVEQVPGRWKKYTYELPENTRFFAIRCVSKNQYILYIDDVTYRPVNKKVVLQGYNVFRDGKQINTELLTGTSFEEVLVGEEDYRYQVNVVYDKGTSILSNEVILGKNTSLADAEELPVEVVTVPGGIAVSGAGQEKVAVYTVQGVSVYQGTGDTVLSLPDSFYLVQVGKRVFKVSVGK